MMLLFYVISLVAGVTDANGFVYDAFPSTPTDDDILRTVHVWQSFHVFDSDPAKCKTLDHLVNVELEKDVAWVKLDTDATNVPTIWKVLEKVLGNATGTHGAIASSSGDGWVEAEKLGIVKTTLAQFGKRHASQVGGTANTAKMFGALHRAILETLKTWYKQHSGSTPSCHFVITENGSPGSTPRVEVPCNSTIDPWWGGFCDCGWGRLKFTNEGHARPGAWCVDVCGNEDGLSSKTVASLTSVFFWLTQMVQMSTCCTGATIDASGASCSFQTTLAYLDGASADWCDVGAAFPLRAMCIEDVNAITTIQSVQPMWQEVLARDPTGCLFWELSHTSLLADKDVSEYLSKEKSSIAYMKHALWDLLKTVLGSGAMDLGIGTDQDLALEIFAQVGYRHRAIDIDIFSTAFPLLEESIILALKQVIGVASPALTPPLTSMIVPPPQHLQQMKVDGQNYVRYTIWDHSPCRLWWREETNIEEPSSGANEGSYKYTAGITLKKFYAVTRCYFEKWRGEIGWLAIGVHVVDPTAFSYLNWMEADDVLLTAKTSPSPKRVHTIKGGLDENRSANEHWFNPKDISAKWTRDYVQTTFSFTSKQLANANIKQSAVTFVYAMGDGSKPKMHSMWGAYHLDLLLPSSGENEFASTPAETNGKPARGPLIRFQKCDAGSMHGCKVMAAAPAVEAEDCICVECDVSLHYVLQLGKCVPRVSGLSSHEEGQWRRLFGFIATMMQTHACCAAEDTWDPTCSKVASSVSAVAKDAWCISGAKTPSRSTKHCTSSTPSESVHVNGVNFFPASQGVYFRNIKEEGLQLYVQWAVSGETTWCAAGINPKHGIMQGSHVVATSRHKAEAEYYVLEKRSATRMNATEEGSLLYAASIEGHFGTATCGVLMKFRLIALEVQNWTETLHVITANGKDSDGFSPTAKHTAHTSTEVDVSETHSFMCVGGCGTGACVLDNVCDCSDPGKTVRFQGARCSVPICANGGRVTEDNSCDCSDSFFLKGEHCDSYPVWCIAIAVVVVVAIVAGVVVAVNKVREGKLSKPAILVNASDASTQRRKGRSGGKSREKGRHTRSSKNRTGTRQRSREDSRLHNSRDGRLHNSRDGRLHNSRDGRHRRR